MIVVGFWVVLDIGVALVVEPIFGQRGSSEPKYLFNEEIVLICAENDLHKLPTQDLLTDVAIKGCIRLRRSRRRCSRTVWIWGA